MDELPKTKEKQRVHTRRIV